MTYKRTLLFTIITLLALLLWGCSGATTPAAQEEADTGAAAPAEEPAAEAEAEPTEAPAEEAEAEAEEPAEAAEETEAEAEETEAEAEAPAEAAEETETEAMGEPVEGGVVVVGLQAEPTTLDSHQSSDYNSARASFGLYDSLLHFKDESTEVEPGLAD